MHDARPVRLARKGSSGAPHQVRPATRPVVAPTPRGGPPTDRRVNRAATQRAIRLSVLYALGIAAVYALLVGIALEGPTGSSAGTAGDLLFAGLLALVLAAIGVLVSLGTAPRAVELGDAETVVVGRFGRRYHFPARDRLHTTVLQRFPAGLLSPVTLESVEIAGGTTRRSFLLDEGLLELSAVPAFAGEGPRA
jgi:hypothetical protein